MQTESILEARLIEKKFSNQPILHQVSLSLYPSSLVTLTGPSGSGKTTLLHILAGLEKPTSGEVFFEGRDLAVLADDARSEIRLKSFGIIFQFFQLLPALSIKENIILPALLLGTSEKEAKKRASELFQHFKLQHRIKAYPNELSGGELQRAALIRSLINQPKIIFADEPTGNLDRASAHLVYELFSELVKEFNVTVFLVTHDPEASQYAATQYQMIDGQLK
jgi:ABC-type lipoprotein export system ATPase subunit